MLRACQAIDAAIEALSRWILSVSGTVLLAVLLLGIALRYVLTESLPWATELPTLLFPVFVMAGIVLAAQHGQHVAVEFLISALPPGARRVLIVLVNLLVAVSYLVLGNTIMDVLPIAGSERTPILGVPGTVVYGAMLAGFALVVVTAITTTIKVTIAGEAALPQPDLTADPT
jgi:TRAP-type C4-dicarboxylate transport system permease small subunit